MFILRLILLFFLGLLGRQLVRAWRGSSVAPPREPATGSPPPPKGPLTDQDISDADYEEIP